MTRFDLSTEGIVLNSIKYGDYDQIATLFTKEVGVIKLMIKGGLSLRRKMNAPLSPLTRAQILCTSGRGELYLCKEVMPLERYHSDTLSFPQLEACCHLAQAIQQSQPLEKPDPDLYQLLHIFLKATLQHHNSDTWVCSFLLKILNHEGMLGDLSYCAACHDPLSTTYALQGEGYCQTHAPPMAVCLSSEEIAVLNKLTHTRHLQELAATLIPTSLLQKTMALFKASIGR